MMTASTGPIGDNILRTANEAAQSLSNPSPEARNLGERIGAAIENHAYHLSDDLGVHLAAREAAATLQAALPTQQRANRSLRAELQEVYQNVLNSDVAKRTAQSADRLFTRVGELTPRDEPLIRQFLSSWGETHVSSDLVGVLATHLHRAGAHDAAGQMMEVIYEDIGGKGTPHRDMFAHFANTICNRHAWRDEENVVKSCSDFRQYLIEARQRAPLDHAILTTAASEIWNVGEYTSLDEAKLNRPILNWMTQSLDVPEKSASKANAYIRVHGGNTELDHFLHAITAWEMLCEHQGTKPDPQLAGRLMREYLENLGDAYEGLSRAITPTRSAQLSKEASFFPTLGLAS